MGAQKTNMWHLKVLSSTWFSRMPQRRPNGGYRWRRLDDISVSANSLLSVLLLRLSSLKCFLFPPVHADSWESGDLQQRQNIASVLEREEESIKVSCEKFPESMKGEVCRICSPGCVRILTSTSARKDACTHTQTLMCDLIHSAPQTRLSYPRALRSGSGLTSSSWVNTEKLGLRGW